MAATRTRRCFAAPAATRPLLLAALVAAAAALAPGQDPLALRAIAAVSGGTVISTNGNAFTDILGSAWSAGPTTGPYSAGALSALSYGTLAADGSGSGPPWQSSGDVLSLCLTSTLLGWAVGNGGTILRTIDGGATWSKQTSPVTVDLYAVACTSDVSAVAVGQLGTIVRTVNAGVTWTKVTMPSTSWAIQDLFCVAFADTLRGIASGLNGQISATADGGATWTDARPPSAQRTPETMLACGVPKGTGTTAYVAGTGGVIIKTPNFATGAGWVQVPTATAQALAAAGDPTLSYAYTAVTAMTFNDANTGWMTTTGGGIVGLTGGATWTIQRNGSLASPHLRDIAAADATHLYAVGNGGTVLASIDGVTWSADPNYPGTVPAGVSGNDVVSVALLPPAPAPPPPVASPPPRPPLPPLPPLAPLAPLPRSPPLPPFQPPMRSPPPLPPSPPPLRPPSPPQPPAPPSPPPSPPSPPRPPSPPPYPVVYGHCKSPDWALPAFIALAIVAGVAIIAVIILSAILCGCCGGRRGAGADGANEGLAGTDVEAAPGGKSQQQGAYGAQSGSRGGYVAADGSYVAAAPGSNGAPAGAAQANSSAAMRNRRVYVAEDGREVAPPPPPPAPENLPPLLAAALGVAPLRGSPRAGENPRFAPSYASASM